MGQTIQQLAHRQLSKPAVFNNRFVVESCESFHFHYRNLRINLSFQDWMSLGKGFSDSFMRWIRKGSPTEGHTELCRKIVATNPHDEGIKINLNRNLYSENGGKIFSEGAGLEGAEYIHFKYRDLRLEMTREEFMTLASAVREAQEKLSSEEIMAKVNSGE